MNQSVTIDVTKSEMQLQHLEATSPLQVWQRRLIILLVLQVLLVIGIFGFQQNSQMQADPQALLAIKIADVDRVVIRDANNQVSLQKSGNGWQLPDQQLPVDKQKLDDILQKMDGVKLTWPVTNTGGSHERFEVAQTKFQRRIELFQGDTKKADIWLGTSPGFKKIHLRREGDNKVYAVELTAFEFPADAKDWLQKDFLAAKNANMIKAANYEIQKNGDNWIFFANNQGANAEKVNPAKANELANAFSNLQIQELATQAPQGETIRILVKSAASEFEYDFIKADNNYYVKRSDRNEYFKLSQYEFERIANITRADLIAAIPEASDPDPVSSLVNQATQGVLNNKSE